MAASIDVSMVMRETFRTAAIDRMFARDSVLYQTSPKFATVPILVDSCVPPCQFSKVEGLEKAPDLIFRRKSR